MSQDSWEYTENENITYEVIGEQRRGGYMDKLIVYRFWPVGSGAWKLQIIDSDRTPIEPILIPAKVIDKIINVKVKAELKEDKR